MRYWSRILLVLALVPALVAPALARSALIETTALLADASEASFRAAVADALVTAMRGALAMGLPLVELQHARRVDRDTVAVGVYATDEESACDDDDATCGEASDREADEAAPASPMLSF